MVIRVQLPDGSIGEFPDGMSDAAIESVLRREYGIPDAPGTPADFSTVSSRVLQDWDGVKGKVDSTAEVHGTKRDIAMGLRSVLQGAGGLIGSIGGDAFNHYLVPGQQPTFRDAAADLADRLELPKPSTGRERVLNDVGEALTGTGLTMGGGGLLNMGKNVLPEGAAAVGNFFSANPVLQTASTAASSGASSAARENGASPLAQTMIGLGAGFVPGAVSPAVYAASNLPGVRQGLDAARSVPGVGALVPDFQPAGLVQQKGQDALKGMLRGENLNGTRRTDADVRRTIDAFTAAGAQPSVGQAGGSRYGAAFETFLGNTPGSSGRIERFAQQQARAVGQQIDDLTHNLSPPGSSLTPQRTGASIVRGIDGPGGFIERFRQQSNVLYNKLDQLVPPNSRVQANNVSGYLAQKTAPIPGASASSKLLANPKLAGIREAIESDLTAGNGTMPYQALARLRSRVGEMIGEVGLTSDLSTKELQGLYGAFSDDIRAAAQATGNPAALSAFNRANSHYRAAMNRLQSIEHVIDKNGGPEKVYLAAVSGVKDGGTTLRKVMQSLDRPQQRELAATFIRRMGKALPGQQDAEGGVFSMRTFLTNWNNTSPEAKKILFDRHGIGFRRDMEKIAKVAEAVDAGSKVFRNTSGTTRLWALITQVSGTGTLAANSLMQGNLGGAAAQAVAISAGSAALWNSFGRIMTDPRAVNWLARNTTKSAAELPAQLQNLRQIGERGGNQEVVDFANAMYRQLTQTTSEEDQPPVQIAGRNK